ncbi:hypothetical protein BST97_12880 [Nonlabens spongiae]|uniref:DUF6705 domain-containing protein n=2 Tax=Nonlabens spongiae TaxID=331648 RepID=A0A1W6MMJ8_9FLAO|nr:hypothetical protein BST97_12880 [Nonlabens spongiae]
MIFKDTNNNFDKFEGTWEYVDATSRLRIVLEKIEDYEDNGYFSDVIVGNLIYEENGVEIINTLTNPSTSQGSDDIYHIKMFSIPRPNLIVGSFEDPIRSKWTRYTLRLIHGRVISMNNSNVTEQLEWGLQIYEFYNPDDDLDAEQAMRVPREVILTKL